MKCDALNASRAASGLGSEAPRRRLLLPRHLRAGRRGAAGAGAAEDDGPALAWRLHVILICLHVLHVNVVTYVIFLLHTGEFTCKIIYM